MEFGQTAPGLLTLVSGIAGQSGAQYVGRWKAADSNFGMSSAEVASLVDDALGDPRGWMGAGMGFEQSPDAPVTYQVVEEANCPGEADLACTEHFGDNTALVTFDYARITTVLPKLPQSLINHESAHAFFFAAHEVGPGGPGIMTGDSEGGWPTAGDIDDVAAWAGTSGGDGTPGKEGYLDLVQVLESNVPAAGRTLESNAPGAFEVWAAEKACRVSEHLQAYPEVREDPGRMARAGREWARAARGARKRQDPRGYVRGLKIYARRVRHEVEVIRGLRSTAFGRADDREMGA